MAFDTNNLVLHIRRLVRSCIRTAYYCACDHPAVLCAAIVLLFLHGLCPTLFTFMLSSSPVIVLTALLLGALLSYGEAMVPLDGQETHETFSHKTNIYITDYLVKEVEDVAVKAQLQKSTETDSGEVNVRERASDDYCTRDTACEEKNVTHIASDAAVLSGEAYVEEERTEVEDVAVKAQLQKSTETDSGEVYVRERASDDYCTCDTPCEEKNVTHIASDAAVLSGEAYVEEERTEVEDVAVKAQLQKSTETDSGEVYVRERASDDYCTRDTPCEEKNVTHIASDAAVLSGEAYIEEERTPNDNFQGTHSKEKNVTFVADDTVLSADPFKNTKISTTVECEESTKEIEEKAELQELESARPGSCNSGVQSQYQFGEFMRSCWQPVIRQDLPCSDSESDLTDESSSPDASMTDIIPMLEDLHPLINLGTGQLSLASKDKLNSSSDDNKHDLGEEEEEEVDVSSDDDEEVEWQQDNRNNWEDIVQLNCLDMEQNAKLENLMELQRAKNILKFELDMRSIDLQAAEATQKLQDASSFHVQVPSISTPRHNPFNPSKYSEETMEFSRIPGSAPSVLLPRRNMFDLRFDRVIDHRSRFQETWSPRSRFRSAQNMRHMNSDGQNYSTCLQHHNGEIGDRHSDDDAEQEGNNGMLFGSLEAHLGEEIKILSAAISDVGVLGEVNHGIDEGNKTSNVRDDTDFLHAVNNSEPRVMEADSMSEVNSLFKCRMEEVLVQSISERSVCQPLEVKPEDIPSVSLSSDSWMQVNEASSVGELNFQSVQLDEGALTCAASEFSGHSDSIRDRSSEASRVADEKSSELPIELDGCRELSTAGDQQTADFSERTELPVLEISSVEEMNSVFKQVEEEVQLSNGRSKINMPQDILPELEVDPVGVNSRSRIIDSLAVV